MDSRGHAVALALNHRGDPRDAVTPSRSRRLRIPTSWGSQTVKCGPQIPTLVEMADAGGLD